LGQKRNHTALAILEKRWKTGTVEEFIASAARQYYGEWVWTVTRLERLALGTRYVEAVDWVEAGGEASPGKVPTFSFRPRSPSRRQRLAG
jgi:hypothetical protein